MEELALSCYGVEVRLVDSADADLCQRLRDALPSEFVAPSGPSTALVSYEVTAGAPEHPQYHITRDGAEVFASPAEEDVFQWLLRDIDTSVALRSRQLLFVHAGVVGWRGLAIVIPGRSLSGKTTLVAELVRRGAIYYSDEFAVLDETGRVQPYARRLTLRGEEEEAHDLRLAWEDVPREPLPMGLIVATSYQPGSAWRPSVVRGAQAVLPLIDNTVLAQEESAKILRIAARIAPSVVTLQGLRSEAPEIAARLLDLVDDALASQAFDADEVGPSRLTADLARIAETRLRAEIARPAPPFRRLVAACYVRMTDFLSPEEHQRLLDHALTCEEAFEDSGIVAPEGGGVVDYGFRRSRTLSGARLEEVWDLFDRRLRAILPAVRQELELAWFPLGEVERQLTAHSGGGFFAPHVDTGNPVVASRRISCVYHFYAYPRRFQGGELKLYDTWVTDTGTTAAPSCTTLTPIGNSVVFFPSDMFHEVCPVHPETEAFGDSRFAVTIWFREGAWPAGAEGAEALA